MNYDEFSKLIMGEVREILPTIPNLDDNTAYMEILTAVFNHPECSKFSNDEISALINTIFLKTRRRLGILDPLINDNNITEIMVNGPQNIFYEKFGEIKKYGYMFDTVEELEEVPSPADVAE